MKKIFLALILIILSTLSVSAATPPFDPSVAKNDIAITQMVDFTTDRVTTNKASAPIDVGQYLPENLIEGKIYVYGGEGIFGPVVGATTGINASTTIPTGETIASAGYFEIKGKANNQAFTNLYFDVAVGATGPVTLTFVGRGTRP